MFSDDEIAERERRAWEGVTSAAVAATLALASLAVAAEKFSDTFVGITRVLDAGVARELESLSIDERFAYEQLLTTGSGKLDAIWEIKRSAEQAG